jgi:16S rRNA (guanine966-N2)-methyltransferase
VRIIAGTARGRPLAGPGGPQTRPTSDKVKGALFSMLETLLVQERPGVPPAPAPAEPGSPELWQGLGVLDLYAGTGALGLEALSRGAAWADFVDANAAARRVIERNRQTVGFADRSRVIGGSVEKLVVGPPAGVLHAPYAVVLLDAPYAQDVAAVLIRLAGAAWLLPGALVAVEHSWRLVPPAELVGPAGGQLTLLRQRRHGDTVLSLYRWEPGPSQQAPPSPAGLEGDRDGGDGDLPR